MTHGEDQSLTGDVPDVPPGASRGDAGRDPVDDTGPGELAPELGSGLIAPPERMDDFWLAPEEQLVAPGRGRAGATADVEGPSRRRRLVSWAGTQLRRPTLEGWIGVGIVAACVAFVYGVVAQPFTHIPDLGWTGLGTVFDNNTPAGGDMGAHVWGPAYLRDHLLPQGRLMGWTPDWYAGMPAYQFYMVVPSLAIALLSYVLPYGVAFKLVAISGIVTLPIAVYLFGRWVDLPFPAPPLMAVGATVFLFDRSFSIYGGNIPSTLAGEFAFSIALTFAWLYLGVFIRGLRTGRLRGWAAILLALTAVCHPIPLIFALVGSAVALACFIGVDRRRFLQVGAPLLGVAAVALAATLRPSFAEASQRPGGGTLAGADTTTTTEAGRSLADLRWETVGPDLALFGYDVPLGVLVAVVALIGYLAYVPGWRRHLFWFPAMAVGGLLSAFWTVPFYLQHQYMNDMGWEKRFDPYNMLFARETMDGNQMVNHPELAWALALGAAGVLLAVIWRLRGGIFLGLLGGAMALAFVHAPDGRLWNARLLPFYYLCAYLLAAIGVAEIGRLISVLFARDPNRPIRTVPIVTAGVGLAAGLVLLVMPLHMNLPFSSVGNDGQYRLAFLSAPEGGKSYIPSWSNWNFSGYENKAAYPEYHDIVTTMAALGERRGCGRAMWEHESAHDRYGTPMALMLLPFWTDSCIGSMEGLYFESSSTTPYHFINQDELSAKPSNAQRDLPYSPGAPTEEEFNRGVEHLKMLGVRYYLAISSHMQGLAATHPDLNLVAESGPWQVYDVTTGNDLVTALEFEPAVVSGLSTMERPRDGTGKQLTGSPWQFVSMLWYTDPDAWDVHLAADGPADWQRVPVGSSPGLVSTGGAAVTDIEAGLDSISFSVDRTGVPVLVKTSYFPNWQVSGAEGPWRVSPNLMVVVPTENEIELTYGLTWVDYLAWVLAIAGIAGVVVLFRLAPIDYRDPPWRPTGRSRRRSSDAPDGDGASPDGEGEQPDAFVWQPPVGGTDAAG